MSQTITGTYRNGTISLDRLPEGVAEARVVVEFVDVPLSAPSQPDRRRGIVHFGMLAPVDGRLTSDEDLEQVKKSWSMKRKEFE